mmetsp:Transcript_138201/g.429609  ORF Transcript_138201/g.429609 Transcript_138201/m.429609 type:complete len:338 (-) Transcript_138201:39-1052(-)
MADVRRADVVVHPVEDAVGPVDGAEGALDPRPVLVAVVRDRGVGVLQPGVEHQPEVDPHVRQDVEHHHGSEAVGAGGADEAAEGQRHAQRRQADAHAPGLGEERRVRPEVVDQAAALHGHGLLHRRAIQPAPAGNVEEEVDRPADHQVIEEPHHREAIVPDDAVEELKAQGPQLLPRVRHVGLALDQVVRLGVVLRVRELPGEVGDEEHGVKHPADGVVQDLVGREAPVPALVRQHPPPDGGGALGEGVEGPAGPLPGRQRPLGAPRQAKEGRGEPIEGGHHKRVAQDEKQGVGHVVLEALLGDRGPQLPHRRHLGRLGGSVGRTCGLRLRRGGWRP